MAALDRPACDGLEFDVRVSSDGVPVICHDPTLERVQGRPERVAEVSAEVLGRFGRADAGRGARGGRAAAVPRRRAQGRRRACRGRGPGSRSGARVAPRRRVLVRARRARIRCPACPRLGALAQQRGPRWRGRGRRARPGLPRRRDRVARAGRRRRAAGAGGRAGGGGLDRQRTAPPSIDWPGSESSRSASRGQPSTAERRGPFRPGGHPALDRPWAIAISGSSRSPRAWHHRRVMHRRDPYRPRAIATMVRQSGRWLVRLATGRAHTPVERIQATSTRRRVPGYSCCDDDGRAATTLPTFHPVRTESAHVFPENRPRPDPGCRVLGLRDRRQQARRRRDPAADAPARPARGQPGGPGPPDALAPAPVPRPHRSPSWDASALQPRPRYARPPWAVHITASLSVMLWALEPLLILFLAAWFLRERIGPSLSRCRWCLAACLWSTSPGARARLLGVALTGGRACCASTPCHPAAGSSADSTAQVVVAQQVYALAFAVVLVPVVWLRRAVARGRGPPAGQRHRLRRPPTPGLLAVPVGAANVPASIAAVSFYLIPIFGVAGGFAFLGERLETSQWAGVLVVLARSRRSCATSTAPTRPCGRMPAFPGLDRSAIGSEQVRRDEPAERPHARLERARHVDPGKRALLHRNPRGPAQEGQELA